MTAKQFADRSNRSQIATLRPYAQKFAQQFGLKPLKISIANHGFNSTFKIVTASGDYALRINTHSIRTPQNLRAEIAWTSQLAKSPISAARPHGSPSGEYILNADLPGHPRPIAAVCYHWLPGRRFPANPSVDLYKSLAVTTANLHKNVPNLADNESLPTLTDCCHDYDFRFTKPEHTLHLPLFQEIRDQANATLKKLAKTNPPQVIHYDLHRSNLKRQGDQIYVLDFDDCLIAPPLMDIAISFYYFRGKPEIRNLEPDFWAAYGSHYSDYGLSEREFEALIAGRRLMLINEFVAIPLEFFQNILPVWIERSVVDFNQFLKTGQFIASK